MRQKLRDFVDITSYDCAMPDGDFVSHEDVSYDSGIGSYKDKSFVEDMQVVQIHDVSGSAEGLAILFGGFDTLGRKQSE